MELLLIVLVLVLLFGGGGFCGVEGMEDSYGESCVDGIRIGGAGVGDGGMAPDAQAGWAAGMTAIA